MSTFLTKMTNSISCRAKFLRMSMLTTKKKKKQSCVDLLKSVEALTTSKISVSSFAIDESSKVLVPMLDTTLLSYASEFS